METNLQILPLRSTSRLGARVFRHDRVVARVEVLESRIALSYTASLVAATATFAGTVANDSLIFSTQGGLLKHNLFSSGGGAGFASDFDFNSAVAGDQTLAAAAASTVNIDTGGGNDAVTFGTPTSPASTLFAAFTVSNTGSTGDTVTIDDSGNALGITLTVTSIQTTGPGISVGFIGAGINGGRTVKTGTGADTIVINSQLGVGTGVEPNLIFSGGGDDVISVGSAGNSLDGFGQAITIDGGAGNDTLIYRDQGDLDSHNYRLDGTNFSRDGDTGLIVPNGTVENRILIGALGASTYDLTGLVGALTVTAGPGSDTLDAHEVIPGIAPLTMNGGGGTDTIIGSIGADLVTGGGGSDVFLGLDGPDVFTWNPGDGSDRVEGGADTDVLVFNGNAVSENFTLSAIGTRLELLRNVGAIDMDVGDVEQVTVNGLGGADAFVVNDLRTSGTRLVQIDVGASDAAADTVTVNGTALPDTVAVSGAGGLLTVAGLPAQVEIRGTGVNDTLIVNGNDGVDALSASAAARALANITLNGEAGAGFDGDRAFGSPTGYDTGGAPVAVATGDITGDGVPDLVVANSKGGVSILAGTATGLFNAAVTVATGGRVPSGLVLGNFDLDADLDLAVTHSGSANVAILLNNGDGTFAAPILLPVAKGPNVVRAAQLNPDSATDLVIASASGKVTVLLGNGDGTFQAGQQFSAGGAGTRDVVVADFNGDSNADVLALNQKSNNVALLLGNGSGGFLPGGQFRTGLSPTAVAVGDFNRDGTLDVAVSHAVSRFVGVLLGNPSVTGPHFDRALRVSYPGIKAPRSVAAGDIDGDGRVDLILANSASGSVSILIGLGNATFARPVEIDLGNFPPPRPSSLAVADFNADGLLDIAVTNQVTNEVSIVLRTS